MAKSKKKKLLNLASSMDILGLDSSDDIDNETSEDTEPQEEGLSKNSIIAKRPDILEMRYHGRKIPLADDGFKKNDDYNRSEDALQAFYKRTKTEEFLKILSGGKIVKFEFGHMLDGYRVNTDDNDENPVIKRFSKAEITKKSFINNINLSVRYINYFITYFDDDDELMAAYFQFMMQLHFVKVKMPVETFIDQIYGLIATPTMVEKVIRMVEYNTDESLIKKSDQKYDESIQLTVEHLKAIMGVSCFHKFIIPIVSHYYTVRQDEVKAAGMTDKDLYYQVFQTFVPLFDDYYDIRLYEKLYHTATTRISKTENQESPMWKRRERFGVTPASFTNDLIRGFLCDISQKVVFSQSAIIYIHVCFDMAIKNELIQPDKYEMSDMKMDASDSVNEIYSRWDRWQTGCTYNSEKDRLRAYVSITDMIWRMGLDVGLNFYHFENDDPDDVSPDPAVQAEYDFYKKHIVYPLANTQTYLIQLYCYKQLSCTKDVDMMKPEDIIKLIMIMKRDLRSRNFSYIPFFISGTLQSGSASSASRSHGRKQLERMFTSHPLYEDWKNQFEDTEGLLSMDRFYGEMKTFVYCPVRAVEYDSEMDGLTLKPTDILVGDEWARFMTEL